MNDIFKKELIIEHKMPWGNSLFYPACETSELVLGISGKKTINLPCIIRLMNLGFKIRYKGPLSMTLEELKASHI